MTLASALGKLGKGVAVFQMVKGSLGLAQSLVQFFIMCIAIVDYDPGVSLLRCFAYGLGFLMIGVVYLWFGMTLWDAVSKKHLKKMMLCLAWNCAILALLVLLVIILSIFTNFVSKEVGVVFMFAFLFQSTSTTVIYLLWKVFSTTYAEPGYVFQQQLRNNNRSDNCGNNGTRKEVCDIGIQTTSISKSTPV